MFEFDLREALPCYRPNSQKVSNQRQRSDHGREPELQDLQRCKSWPSSLRMARRNPSESASSSSHFGSAETVYCLLCEKTAFLAYWSRMPIRTFSTSDKNEKLVVDVGVFGTLPDVLLPKLFYNRATLELGLSFHNLTRSSAT